MRYLENAPRDYASYNRDLNLYFEDLKGTRAEIDRLIDAFADTDQTTRLQGKPAFLVEVSDHDLAGPGGRRRVRRPSSSSILTETRSSWTSTYDRTRGHPLAGPRQ